MSDQIGQARRRVDNLDIDPALRTGQAGCCNRAPTGRNSSSSWIPTGQEDAHSLRNKVAKHADASELNQYPEARDSSFPFLSRVEEYSMKLEKH